MQGAFTTGHGIDLQRGFHDCQNLPVQAALVWIIGRRSNWNDVPPHIAGGVQRICTRLIQMAQVGGTAPGETLFKQTVHRTDTALPVGPGHIPIEQSKDMIRAGVTGNKPQPLVELGIAVGLKEVVGVFE